MQIRIEKRSATETSSEHFANCTRWNAPVIARRAVLSLQRKIGKTLQGARVYFGGIYKPGPYFQMRDTATGYVYTVYGK